LVEYIGYHPFDLKAKGAEEQWGAPRYLAFVLHAGEIAEPVLIDLGEAEAIDEAIRAFRQEIAQANQTIQRLGEAEAERQLMAIIFAQMH
jgi:hypothetical protein